MNRYYDLAQEAQNVNYWWLCYCCQTFHTEVAAIMNEHMQKNELGSALSVVEIYCPSAEDQILADEY